MVSLDEIHVDLNHLASEVRRLSDEVQSAGGRTAEKILKLRLDRKQISVALDRMEKALQRLEEASQRVERISPQGLASRIPKSTLEEARRIVAEAEAKGEEVSPPSPQFKDTEDISGVWMVVTDKVKWKIPNWIIRGVLTALLGGLLTYLGIAIHDVKQTPLVNPPPMPMPLPVDGGRP